MPDAFSLARFAEAQNPIYSAIVAELRAGQKRNHWMWFVFPQIAGLGQSSTSRHYAIHDLAEAQAYLSDETLGTRLTECTNLVLTHPNKTATQIFGPIDNAKFRSSMTLFTYAAPANPLFQSALKTFFNAEPDELTLQKLNPSLQP